MLIIIHGEDTVSTRKALEQEKLKDIAPEVIFFNGKDLELSDLVTACQSVSLLPNPKIIIIENLFSSGMNKTKEILLSYLNQIRTENKIILWEKSEITKTNIKKYLMNAREIFCNPPLVLFKFLDSLGFNKASMLSLFHSILRQREAELIYSMILRQIRMLIIFKDLGAKGFKLMQSWQIRKLEKQSALFTIEKLVKYYRQLLAIDFQVKNGLTPFKLSELLDIFLISL